MSILDGFFLPLQMSQYDFNNTAINTELANFFAAGQFWKPVFNNDSISALFAKLRQGDPIYNDSLDLVAYLSRRQVVSADLSPNPAPFNAGKYYKITQTAAPGNGYFDVEKSVSGVDPDSDLGDYIILI